MCLALLLRSKRKSTAGPVLGVLTVPRALPRLVPMPSSDGTIDYIFLHELIEAHAARVSGIRGAGHRSIPAVSATATCISRKRKRGRCSKACAPSCTTVAKATPCGWK